MLWTRNAAELHMYVSEFTSNHLNILELRKTQVKDER